MLILLGKIFKACQLEITNDEILQKEEAQKYKSVHVSPAMQNGPMAAENYSTLHESNPGPCHPTHFDLP